MANPHSHGSGTNPYFENHNPDQGPIQKSLWGGVRVYEGNYLDISGQQIGYNYGKTLFLFSVIIIVRLATLRFLHRFMI